MGCNFKCVKYHYQWVDDWVIVASIPIKQIYHSKKCVE